MAIESKERRIGATTYRVTQLPAKRGRAMLVRFVRLLGPAAGAFASGVGRGARAGVNLDALMNANVAMLAGFGIGDALHDLCTRLNEEDLSAMCDEFAEYTVVVQSREIEQRLSKIFDDHFAGRYDEMFQWFRACCEVNFASFFAGSSGANPLAKLVDLISKWQSQTGSTGISTASPPASTMQTPS